MPLVSSLASLVAAMREHECSIVVRAVLSPTAVLLLLPVASLLAICLLLHWYGGVSGCRA